MFKKLKLWLFALIICIPACVHHPTIPTSRESAPVETLYNQITLEIVSAPGQGPDARALAFFINKLKQYDICHRIVIVYKPKIKNVYPVWNSGLVHQFEKNNRKLHDDDLSDKNLVLFICYLPGVYIEGDKTNIAGIKYEDTSFAIFRQNVDVSYEGVVLLHEFGHIIKIARADNREEEPVNPDRPNHCNNTDCTMYWQAGKHRTKLDAQCLRELRQLVADR